MSNTQQRITELETKLSQLQQELDAIKNSPKDWPQDGEDYFYLNGYGKIAEDTYAYTPIDDDRKALGNIFKTREEAEAELHARLTIAKLRSQPGRKKFLAHEDNWTVEIHCSYSKVTNGHWNNISGGFASTYFESEEAVENAIKAVGADNILKASRWLAMGEV